MTCSLNIPTRSNDCACQPSDDYLASGFACLIDSVQMYTTTYRNSRALVFEVVGELHGLKGVGEDEEGVFSGGTSQKIVPGCLDGETDVVRAREVDGGLCFCQYFSGGGERRSNAPVHLLPMLPSQHREEHSLGCMLSSFEGKMKADSSRSPGPKR